jgi:hypothetical protein
MIFPLQTLLSIKLDNVRLVVDNAKSPSDPVSFRNKRSCFGYCTSNSTKNRWSSISNCVEVLENKDTTTLQITKCSNSTDVKLSSPAILIKNETSCNGVTPVRVPIRQLSRARSLYFPAINKRGNLERSISCPLRAPVRHVSPLVTRAQTTKSHKMTKSDIKSMTSISRDRPIRTPIRRRSLKGPLLG